MTETHSSQLYQQKICYPDTEWLLF